MRRYSGFLKFNAAWLIGCFTFTTIAWSAPPLPAKAEVRLPSLADTLEIPKSIGTINERYTSQSTPTIIHIQDAHAHYEAQQHTKDILEHLYKKYDVELLFLEGGVDKINAKLLEFFNDPELDQKVADGLTKYGMVGGAELFLLETWLKEREVIPAFGVENPKIYKNNLEAYRSVLREEKQSKAFLENLKTKILKQSSIYFNKDLKTFFQKWIFYQDKPNELLRHLEHLGHFAQEKLKLNLTNPFEQINWPQLVRFFKLKEFEQSLDLQKVEEEKQQLLNWMGEQGIDESLLFSVISAEAGISGDSSIRTQLERFYAAAAPKGFSFEQYPHFKIYAGAMILQNEIDAKLLMEESIRLGDEILAYLAKIEIEKEIIILYKDYLLIQKLLGLELIATEYETIQARKEVLKPSVLLNRAVGIASPVPLGVAYPPATEQENVYPKHSLVMKQSLLNHEELDKLFARAVQFYRGAREREFMMMQNMMARMKQTGKQKAVLITGGFHSQGLTEEFRKNNFSYIEITPRISEIGDDKVYKQSMMLELPFPRLTGQAAISSTILRPRITSTMQHLPKTDIQYAAEILTFLLQHLITSPSGRGQSEGWVRESIQTWRTQVTPAKSEVRGVGNTAQVEQLLGYVPGTPTTVSQSESRAEYGEEPRVLRSLETLKKTIRGGLRKAGIPTYGLGLAPRSELKRFTYQERLSKEPYPVDGSEKTRVAAELRRTAVVQGVSSQGVYDELGVHVDELDGAGNSEDQRRMAWEKYLTPEKRFLAEIDFRLRPVNVPQEYAQVAADLREMIEGVISQENPSPSDIEMIYRTYRKIPLHSFPKSMKFLLTDIPVGDAADESAVSRLRFREDGSSLSLMTLREEQLLQSYGRLSLQGSFDYQSLNSSNVHLRLIYDLSDDGSMAAYTDGTSHASIRLLHFDTGEISHKRLPNSLKGGVIREVAFLNDGKRVAAIVHAGKKPRWVTWNLEENKETSVEDIPILLKGNRSLKFSMPDRFFISPSGTTFAFQSEDEKLWFFRRRGDQFELERTPLFKIPTDSRTKKPHPFSIAYSSDGTHLALAVQDPSAQLDRLWVWEISDGIAQARIRYQPVYGKLLDLRFTSNNEWLLISARTPRFERNLGREADKIYLHSLNSANTVPLFYSGNRMDQVSSTRPLTIASQSKRFGVAHSLLVPELRTETASRIPRRAMVNVGEIQYVSESQFTVVSTEPVIVTIQGTDYLVRSAEELEELENRSESRAISEGEQAGYLSQLQSYLPAAIGSDIEVENWVRGTLFALEDRELAESVLGVLKQLQEAGRGKSGESLDTFLEQSIQLRKELLEREDKKGIKDWMRRVSTFLGTLVEENKEEEKGPRVLRSLRTLKKVLQKEMREVELPIHDLGLMGKALRKFTYQERIQAKDFPKIEAELAKAIAALKRTTWVHDGSSPKVHEVLGYHMNELEEDTSQENVKTAWEHLTPELRLLGEIDFRLRPVNVPEKYKQLAIDLRETIEVVILQEPPSSADVEMIYRIYRMIPLHSFPQSLEWVSQNLPLGTARDKNQAYKLQLLSLNGSDTVNQLYFGGTHDIIRGDHSEPLTLHPNSEQVGVFSWVEGEGHVVDRGVVRIGRIRYVSESQYAPEVFQDYTLVSRNGELQEVSHTAKSESRLNIDHLTVEEFRGKSREAYASGRTQWKSGYEEWERDRKQNADLQLEKQKKFMRAAGTFIIRKYVDPRDGKRKFHLILAQRGEKAKDRKGFFSAPVGAVNKDRNVAFEERFDLRGMLARGLAEENDIDLEGKIESVPMAGLRESIEEAGVPTSAKDKKAAKYVVGRINGFRGNHLGIHVNFIVYVDDVQSSELQSNGELENSVGVPLELILSKPADQVGQAVEEHLQEIEPNSHLMHGLKVSGIRHLQHFLHQVFSKPGTELVEIFKTEGLIAATENEDQSSHQVRELLNPPPKQRATEESLERVILPDYFSGPFLNQQIRGRPEWDGNRKYMRGLFKREMAKAIRQGLFEGDERFAEERFEVLMEAFLVFEDRKGQIYYDRLTNIENVKIALRLSHYVLFGSLEPNPVQVEAMEVVAHKANQIARDALRGSLFTERLQQLLAAQSIGDQTQYLREAMQMALYAAAPNIWFSSSDAQSNEIATIKKVHQLLEESLKQSLALDSIQDFVTKILNSNEPLELSYWVDDNGDLIAHLYLIQAYLKINPNLKIILIAKQGRYAIDSTIEDVRYELRFSEFWELAQSDRFSVLEEGPQYAGIHLRNAPQSVIDAFERSDYWFGLGQTAVENMNGVRKPGFISSYVDANVHQAVTGLKKGDLYFARVESSQKYFDDYPAIQDGKARTLKETFLAKSESRTSYLTPLKTEAYLELSQKIENAIASPEFPGKEGNSQEIGRAIAREILIEGNSLDNVATQQEVTLSAAKTRLTKANQFLTKWLLNEESEKEKKQKMKRFRVESRWIHLYGKWYQDYYDWVSNKEGEKDLPSLDFEYSGIDNDVSTLMAMLFEKLGIPDGRKVLRIKKGKIQPKWHKVFGYTLQILDENGELKHQFLIADKEGNFLHEASQYLKNILGWGSHKTTSTFHLALLMEGAYLGRVKPDLKSALRLRKVDEQVTKATLLFPKDYALVSERVPVPSAYKGKQLRLRMKHYNIQEPKKELYLLTKYEPHKVVMQARLIKQKDDAFVFETDFGNQYIKNKRVNPKIAKDARLYLAGKRVTAPPLRPIKIKWDSLNFGKKLISLTGEKPSDTLIPSFYRDADNIEKLGFWFSTEVDSSEKPTEPVVKMWINAEGKWEYSTHPRSETRTQKSFEDVLNVLDSEFQKLHDEGVLLSDYSQLIELSDPSSQKYPREVLATKMGTLVLKFAAHVYWLSNYPEAKFHESLKAFVEKAMNRKARTAILDTYPKALQSYDEIKGQKPSKDKVTLMLLGSLALEGRWKRLMVFLAPYFSNIMELDFIDNQAPRGSPNEETQSYFDLAKAYLPSDYDLTSFIEKSIAEFQPGSGVLHVEKTYEDLGDAVLDMVTIRSIFQKHGLEKISPTHQELLQQLNSNKTLEAPMQQALIQAGSVLQDSPQSKAELFEVLIALVFEANGGLDYRESQNIETAFQQAEAFVKEIYPDLALSESRIETSEVIARTEAREEHPYFEGIDVETLLEAFKARNRRALMDISDEFELAELEVTASGTTPGEPVDPEKLEATSRGMKYLYLIRKNLLGFEEFGDLRIHGFLDQKFEDSFFAHVVYAELELRFFEQDPPIETVRGKAETFLNDFMVYASEKGEDWRQSIAVKFRLFVLTELIRQKLQPGNRESQPSGELREKLKILAETLLKGIEENAEFQGHYQDSWTQEIAFFRTSEEWAYLSGQMSWQEYQENFIELAEAKEEMLAQSREILETLRNADDEDIQAIAEAVNEEVEENATLMDEPQDSDVTFMLAGTQSVFKLLPMWYTFLQNTMIFSAPTGLVSSLKGNAGRIFEIYLQLREADLNENVYRVMVAETLQYLFEANVESDLEAINRFVDSSQEYEKDRARILFYVIRKQLFAEHFPSYKAEPSLPGHVEESQTADFTGSAVDVLEKMDTRGRFLRFYETLRKHARTESRAATSEEVVAEMERTVFTHNRNEYSLLLQVIKTGRRRYELRVTPKRKSTSFGFSSVMIQASSSDSADSVSPYAMPKTFQFPINIRTDREAQDLLVRIFRAIQNGSPWTKESFSENYEKLVVTLVDDFSETNKDRRRRTFLISTLILSLLGFITGTIGYWVWSAAEKKRREEEARRKAEEGRRRAVLNQALDVLNFLIRNLQFFQAKQAVPKVELQVRQLKKEGFDRLYEEGMEGLLKSLSLALGEGRANNLFMGEEANRLPKNNVAVSLVHDIVGVLSQDWDRVRRIAEHIAKTANAELTLGNDLFSTFRWLRELMFFGKQKILKVPISMEVLILGINHPLHGIETLKFFGSGFWNPKINDPETPNQRRRIFDELLKSFDRIFNSNEQRALKTQHYIFIGMALVRIKMELAAQGKLFSALKSKNSELAIAAATVLSRLSTQREKLIFAVADRLFQPGVDPPPHAIDQFAETIHDLARFNPDAPKNRARLGKLRDALRAKAKEIGDNLAVGRTLRGAADKIDQWLKKHALGRTEARVGEISSNDPSMFLGLGYVPQGVEMQVGQISGDSSFLGSGQSRGQNPQLWRLLSWLQKLRPSLFYGSFDGQAAHPNIKKVTSRIKQTMRAFKLNPSVKKLLANAAARVRLYEFMSAFERTFRLGGASIFIIVGHGSALFIINQQKNNKKLKSSKSEGRAEPDWEEIKRVADRIESQKVWEKVKKGLDPNAKSDARAVYVISEVAGGVIAYAYYEDREVAVAMIKEISPDALPLTSESLRQIQEALEIDLKAYLALAKAKVPQASYVLAMPIHEITPELVAELGGKQSKAELVVLNTGEVNADRNVEERHWNFLKNNFPEGQIHKAGEDASDVLAELEERIPGLRKLAAYSKESSVELSDAFDLQLIYDHHEVAKAGFRSSRLRVQSVRLIQALAASTTDEETNALLQFFDISRPEGRKVTLGLSFYQHLAELSTEHQAELLSLAAA